MGTRRQICIQNANGLRTHAKELHARLPVITKDFGPILTGAVWDYHPDHELRHDDFLEDYRRVEALRSRLAPDFDVSDPATWSVISALSKESVADRSRFVDFLDFTKGKWKLNRPVQIHDV